MSQIILTPEQAGILAHADFPLPFATPTERQLPTSPAPVTSIREADRNSRLQK